MDRISVAEELKHQIDYDFQKRMELMGDTEDRIQAALNAFKSQRKEHKYTKDDSLYDLCVAVEDLFHPELCEGREEETGLEFEYYCEDHKSALLNIEANIVLPDMKSLYTLKQVLPKCRFLFLPSKRRRRPLTYKPFTLIYSKLAGEVNIPTGSGLVTVDNTARLSILKALVDARSNSFSYAAGALTRHPMS